MNETATTKKSEFVFRRVAESFDQFTGDLWSAIPTWPLALVAVFVVARIVYRFSNTNVRPQGVIDPTARALGWGMWISLAVVTVWTLIAFYNRDSQQVKAATETLATVGSGNEVKWYTFVLSMFALASVFVVLMYIKDSRSVRWYFAAPLALLRITVYAILCVVFLLPAMQTWEDTNKQSRVIILLDLSPSVTTVSDEIGTTSKKLKTRMDVLIEFLTDEKVAFVKRLLEKNPVAVYAFGTRLDESPTIIGQEQGAWSKAEWESFAKYDFKPFVLRGLSDDAKAQIQNAKDWVATTGDADWAAKWFARKGDAELKAFANLEADADVEILRRNLEKLDKRIDIARTITLGTNVPDSVTAAINRESSNMVQGIIVFSDGRSNLGSDSSYTELRDRATREKIPVFTVAVGEDRQQSSIAITELQAPDSAPIDEPWKIFVEADGTNLANKEVEVFLDLYKPGNQPPRNAKETDAPDHTLKGKLVFAPGDPPHGQAEFVIDPATLPEKLTAESKDAAIKKRVLLEGKWAARARIAKDPQEAFADAQHFSPVREVNVVQQKLRILLMAGAPSREFVFLRTMLVREVQDKRATLTTFIQNEAGTTNKLTAEQDETLIQRFPNRFDLKTAKIDPSERPYNLNEYDVLIAFDPDWSELSLPQSEDLARWVKEGGGGLIYIAGSINTFQLARIEENSRLDPLLKILPVVPADIIALRIKPTPKTPRRLYLNPKAIIGSDLLKLDDKVLDDPIAGWEQFFTDRDKYVPNVDLKVELIPRRGFFSCYPLKPDVGVKPGSAVLAEFADVGDAGEVQRLPYLVTNNPSGAWRTAFLASGEMYKMRAFEPETGTGREYFERFWFKLIKYMAGKRNIKAPRGRILVAKEAVSGAPLRVQARILDDSAKPYEINRISPKFKIIQEAASGGNKREFGPFDLAAKPTPSGGFDGYYAGQELLDAKQYPVGDSLYRVEIEIPDSPGDKLSTAFKIRKADPEMDNTKPDFAAMLRMASAFDATFDARLPHKVKVGFGTQLPKDGDVHRLAFKITDKELLDFIPDCMITEKRSAQNRGPVNDLWDRGNFEITRERALLAPARLLSTVVVFAVVLVLWATLASAPTWLRTTLATTWWLLLALGLMAVFLMTLLGAYEPVLWMLAVGEFALAVLLFKVAWSVRARVLLTLGVISIAAHVGVSNYIGSYGFDGVNIPISVALLAVVSLLSFEWLGRKLLRLA